jgi:hypothetical protein
MEAYKAKGITPDPESQKGEPPLIEDLYKALIGMEEEKARTLAARFEKYIKGSFAGIFNQKTTVNLNNKFVVFGIRNLEDTLRPVAMQIILDYIWTVVKNNLKRRILIVDEAWYLMQYEDSASFLRGIVKRGRKYYLGVTTITQDVDDFLKTNYGKEIVTNSSLQILLKQHSAAIDQIGEVFYLSEGEKQLLLSADKGEGIFFAGQNHVAIKVISSPEEHKLITSNPQDVLDMKKAAGELKNDFVAPILPPSQGFTPVNKYTNNTEKAEIKPVIENKIEAPKAELPKNNLLITPPVSFTPPIIKTETVPIVEVKNNENNIFSSRPEVVVLNNTENILQKRINELEEVEKNELKEHEMKVNNAQVEQKVESNNLGKTIFDSNKLPPLPKFEAPKNLDMFKAEPVEDKKEVPKPPLNTNINNLENKKPVFINQAEIKIPQPPQFAKQIKPDFVAPEKKPVETVNNEAGSDNKNKLNYEDIFGDGIV